MNDDFTHSQLEHVVIELLCRIPLKWGEYDHDGLSKCEEKALYHLVAAGLIERRIRMRTRFRNHPIAFELTVTATGEYGFAEALRPMVAEAWEIWGEQYRIIKDGETAADPVTVTEYLSPSEWRLTDQGEVAMQDVKENMSTRVVDFVLKQVCFDGRSRSILEPGKSLRFANRLPVRGYGRLVSIKKVNVDIHSPSEVKIKNWDEGAKHFADAFKGLSKDQHPIKSNSDGFTVSQVCEMCGLSTTTINSYAKRAGLVTPGSGKKNFRYSRNAVRQLLKAIMEGTTDSSARDRCLRVLEDLR